MVFLRCPPAFRQIMVARHIDAVLTADPLGDDQSMWQAGAATQLVECIQVAVGGSRSRMVVSGDGVRENGGVITF
jgi:hypothetical protein